MDVDYEIIQQPNKIALKQKIERSNDYSYMNRKSYDMFTTLTVKTSFHDLAKPQYRFVWPLDFNIKLSVIRSKVP